MTPSSGPAHMFWDRLLCNGKAWRSLRTVVRELESMADTKVLIAFYSRTGVTKALSGAIAEGARKGAKVRLRGAREIAGEEIMANVPGWAEAVCAMNASPKAPSMEDALWANAIIFGTPTRYGAISSELKAYADGLGGLWAHGELNNFWFISSRLDHRAGGLCRSVPLQAGTPYGASAVSYNQATPPTSDELEVARFQGRWVAHVAEALKRAAVA